LSTDRALLPAELVPEWRSAADVIRVHNPGSAAAYEHCAMMLESALTAVENSVLTLQEGAKLSGYSADHLRKLVGKTIPNAGRKHAPKIRRGDLPVKPGRKSESSYDPSADAVRLMGQGRGA
jgi:hypothetical protein